ncbi:hypothetical protein KR044_004046, partial [Drosophila immigrans]
LNTKMAKIQNPKEMFDSKDYPALLSTLSLNDVMVLEFQMASHTKWENMVLCKDPTKKMYLCNVCNVFQYGDKNLHSHLAGKKHIFRMEIVKHVRIPKAIGIKNSAKKPPNTQVKTVPKNIGQTPATSAKNTNKSSPVIQPNKSPAGAISKPIVAKPQVASTSKPVAVSPSVANTTKTITTKAPVKPLATKTPVASTSKPIAKAAASNSSVSIASKLIATKAPVKPTITNPSSAATLKSNAPKASADTPKPIATKVPVGITPKPILAQPVDSNTKLSVTKSQVVSTSKPVATKSQAGSISIKTAVTPQVGLTSKANATKPQVKYASKSNSTETKTTNAEPSIIKKSEGKQISCVPLSKLITFQNTDDVNKKTAKVVDNDDDEVILLDSEMNTSSNRAKEKNKGGEKVITPKTSTKVNYSPSPPLTFDNSKNMTEILGLIGVEYVLKIVRSMSDTSPRFLCSLCDINADEISMHNHLISINHRLKYCEKHFPTAIRQYRQHISHIPEHQVFKVLTPILNKLAIAIETHHGRENAYHCYEYWFSKNKKSLLSTVFHRRHASEETGPTFTHVVDSNEVEMFIENAYNKVDQPMGAIIRLTNNEPPHTSFNNSNNMFRNQQQPIQNYTNKYVQQSNNQPHNVQSVDDETHKRMVENFLRDTRQSHSSRHRHPARAPKRHRSRSPTPQRKQKRSSPLIASQWNVERRSLSPLRDGDIWQAYRHMVDHSVRELNKAFELYKSDPEEHPLYKDEWQKFWKRRKDELIASGINHRTYNYQSEWILFFNVRLEELYNQALENIKIKCRGRLCLPMKNDELTDSKYHVHISDDPPEPAPPQEPLIENIAESRRVPVEHRREPSPKPKPKPSEKKEVNVIHVLRLLTALEDYLGSLGPGITELLAKALQISKVHPDKVNSLILTNENCVILETAKEKFTGLIISKMLESNQERALKKAVNDTEALLEFAAEMSPQCPIENMETENSTAGQAHGNSFSNQDAAQKAKSPGSYKISDQIDKTELAAKLASSLISQGKTKINPEQLKQIIQVYSLIEQKKLQEPSSTST